MNTSEELEILFRQCVQYQNMLEFLFKKLNVNDQSIILIIIEIN